MPDTSQTLDLGAFKHVVVPIGVVIALGVARIVTAISHYIQHQDRIRFSWTHAVWAGLLFLWFVGLWWISWGLRHVDAERWSYFTLIYLLVGPSLMYLATTLLLPDVPDGGELDLGGRFDGVGRAFFACLAGFVLWLACVELLLLRESFLVPKRANQSVLLVMFLVGAAFPSRRTAAILAGLTLPLALLALATVRAKLA
jgi:Na+/melibiose symporter-like transporter